MKISKDLEKKFPVALFFVINSGFNIADQFPEVRKMVACRRYAIYYVPGQKKNFLYLCRMKRRIITYGGYFEAFNKTLDEKVQDKVDY